MSFIVEDVLIHSNVEQTLLEVHNLAYFYHWPREQCWHCPCTERGVFNDQIRQQIKAETGKGSKGSSSSSKPYKEGRG